MNSTLLVALSSQVFYPAPISPVPQGEQSADVPQQVNSAFLFPLVPVTGR